jgi:hypothetical protein
VETIDKDGIMTKDLALAIHGKEMKREHWVVTDKYMDAVNVSGVLLVNERTKVNFSYRLNSRRSLPKVPLLTFRPLVSLYLCIFIVYRQYMLGKHSF